MEGLEKVSHLLDKIYGGKNGQLALGRIEVLIEKYQAPKSKKDSYFSQQDVVLITYGESLKRDG